MSSNEQPSRLSDLVFPIDENRLRLDGDGLWVSTMLAHATEEPRLPVASAKVALVGDQVRVRYEEGDTEEAVIESVGSHTLKLRILREGYGGR